MSFNVFILKNLEHCRACANEDRKRFGTDVVVDLEYSGVDEIWFDTLLVGGRAHTWVVESSLFGLLSLVDGASGTCQKAGHTVRSVAESRERARAMEIVIARKYQMEGLRQMWICLKMAWALHPVL